jgi:GT2 family glycosyltransferase
VAEDGHLEDATGHTVSVVIVNKGDVRVDDTLATLIIHDDPAIREIIVVDASAHRFDAVRDRYPQVRWIDYAHPFGKPRTIAEQRNVGIRAAQGGVIAFLDANCIPAEGWATQLVAPMLSGGERVVVGRVTSAVDASIHDVGKGQGGVDPAYLDECSNMNTAVRRDVFDAVGTFSETLGFAEDVDFSWRVRDAVQARLLAWRPERARARPGHEGPERNRRAGVAPVPSSARPALRRCSNRRRRCERFLVDRVQA